MSISLLELGSVAGTLLNEQGPASMWTRKDLSVYARLAFENFQRMAVRKNPEFGNSSFNFTYPSGTQEHEIPLTELDPATILNITDQTVSPSSILEWAGSQREILDLQNAGNIQNSLSKVYISRLGDNLQVQIGPAPNSARSIRIYFQQTPANFISHASMKTGLPDPYDRCIIFEVCRLARTQEQNLELAQHFTGLLREAKMDVARYIRSLKRGSKRVRYDPDDYR